MNSSKLKRSHANSFKRAESFSMYAAARSISAADGGRATVRRYVACTADFRSLLALFKTRSATAREAFSTSELFIRNKACGAVTVLVRMGQGSRPSSTSKLCRKLEVTSRLEE